MYTIGLLGGMERFQRHWTIVELDDTTNRAAGLSVLISLFGKFFMTAVTRAVIYQIRYHAVVNQQLSPGPSSPRLYLGAW